MASGPQQQEHQPHLIQHQQTNRQMQFSPSHNAGLASASYDQQQQPQQQQPQTLARQHSTMSPTALTPVPVPVNHTQGHGLSMNTHHQQQQSSHAMGQMVGSGILSRTPPGNQTSTSHVRHPQQSQSQKSQILPLLLSPQPPNITPNPNDHTEHSENDHEQIIDQVISLENEYSDTSNMMTGNDGVANLMMNHQQQQHQLGDINLSGCVGISDNNQFSSSSEDLLNLLLEFDREPSNLIGISDSQQLDQDEKVGIENIRKQLMSCEVQSEPPHQNTSMSPVVDHMTCPPQQAQGTQPQQRNNSVHQQQVTQQLISQSATVIPHHQLPHQIASSSSSPQQQMPSDQSISLQGPYSTVPMSTVPVSSSGQSYAPQQPQQHVSRVSQTSSSVTVVSSSPSPSWQQTQLSPFSPQPPHNNNRTLSQLQGQQQHPLPQHQTTTSTQMQQLHHPLQQRSPSQSVSPPATSEPSPVVKKNPLLNAQLINTRAPSITPTRFMNSQTSVLNQNPILNSKLNQGPFVGSTGPVASGLINSNLNQQARYIQPTQQQSNFNFEINEQQQQQNAQQQSSQSQAGRMSLYGTGDQHQANDHIFRSSATVQSGGTPMNIGHTSPSGGLRDQVKQEIRKKVQPKQHQTTSLLKQLLSDDNK